MAGARRAMRFLIEDTFPSVGVPAAHVLALATRPDYRRTTRRTRELGRRVSSDLTVQGGPFAGMRYLALASGSSLLPKLVGTYELEIAAEIERAIDSSPDIVVDVGSAEGYYAVGMAFRLPATRVVAFDRRASARHLARRLARLNDVEVELHGAATHADLQALLAGATAPLVICDIDGGEADLIDLIRVPALRCARLIIETHDMFVANVTALLVERLASTHKITRYDAEPRTAVDLPGFDSGDAAVAMDERRPERQSWLACSPTMAG